ncbi:MAG TPA: hypothetical protein VIL99_14090 [Ignavibacteria bacterium]
MARKNKIDTETLINLIDKFLLEKCDGNVKQLKIPEIGNYIRDNGYEVEDYLIRRNQVARQHIKKFNDTSEEEHFLRVAVFRDINYELFFQRNTTKGKIISGLKDRDDYYRKITVSAAHAFEENRKLEKENNELLQKNIELKEQFSHIQRYEKSSSLVNKEYIDENKKLREIIDIYVYPEIANELLREQGLIKNTAEIVDSTALDREIISADDKIPEIKTNIIKGLFDKL